MNKLEKYPIQDIALSRIGHQYGESENFKQFIGLTLEPLLELQDSLFKLLDIDLDTAKGVKLDLIGRIVGAPALIYDAVPQPFFGFDEQEEALEFGEIDDPEVGGFFREVGQPSNTDYILDNDEYKKVVTAQIIKNNSDCNADDIIKIVELLTEKEFKYYELPMAVVIAPKEPLNRQERRLIEEMLPIPAGVALGILNGKYDALTVNWQEKIEVYEDEY